MMLRAIHAIRLISHDGARLARFYAAIGFTVAAPEDIPEHDRAQLGLEGAGRRWPMRLGAQRVEIDEYDRSGAAYPDDTDSAASCFQHFAIVTTRIEDDWQRVKAAGANPISDHVPVQLPARSGGVTAVKFRDPDGHPLELLQFPDPEKQGWNGQGIQGIDHSAISVVDLERTMAFFQRRGLSCAGASHNHGTEQDALDGITGADVQVRSLTPVGAPPHLELLAYDRSSCSQPYRGGLRDVASTRIVWSTNGKRQVFRDPSGHWHETI